MDQMGIALTQWNSRQEKIEQFSKLQQEPITECNFTQIPWAFNNEYLVYLDTFFDKPWKPAKGAIAYCDTRGRLLAYKRFQIPHCESSTIAEIITVIHTIHDLPRGAMAHMRIDNQITVKMSTKVRCNYVYTQYFWKVAAERNLNLDLQWVKGHTFNSYNREVDCEANWARQSGESKDITRLILKSNPDHFFLIRGGTLAPNIKQIIHCHYQKLNLQEQIKATFDYIKYNKAYDKASYNNWKSNYPLKVTSMLAKAKWDVFYNKDLKTLLEKNYWKCGVPETIRHKCEECQLQSNNLKTLENSIQRILTEIEIKQRVTLVWEENSNPSNLESSKTIIQIGLRGMIPKALMRTIRQHCTPFPYPDLNGMLLE
jgi:hypothetical protein